MPKWTFRSLIVAAIAWTVGWGGILIVEYRSPPPIPGMQANYSRDMGLQVLAGLTLLIGPPVGMAMGILALLDEPGRRGLALIGLGLNFWVWGLFVSQEAAIYAIGRPHPSHFWMCNWIAYGTTSLGIISTVGCGWWMDSRRAKAEAPGFNIEPVKRS